MTQQKTRLIYIKGDATEVLSKERLIEIIADTYDFDMVRLTTDFDISHIVEIIDPEFVTSILFTKHFGVLTISVCLPNCKMNDFWRFRIGEDGSIRENEFKDETLIAMRKSLSQKNKANKI